VQALIPTALMILWDVFKIILIILPLIIAVAYMTFFERKVIAYIQVRRGPNRVGLFGILQPIADAIKMMTKELIVPSQANKPLYKLAPMITFVPAILAWAVIPFSDKLVLANINIGLLYVFAMTSMGVYGIIIAGWSSNSKYPMYGALRAAAQVVSYELAMGFALVGVVMAAGSTNLSQIVLDQQGAIWHWYFVPLFPLFVVYWISGLAETNRLPFDVVEGETEIAGGTHAEYSGMRFGLFFLSEYANMILISALVSILFLGGWLSPFQGMPLLGHWLSFVPGIIWLFMKMGLFLFFFLWIRGTFPRYRYDQIMRLGWKVFIPLTLVWVVVVAIMAKLAIGPWFSHLH